MSIATIEIQPRVKNVEILNGHLTITIHDGRVLSVPLEWYPRLLHGTLSEQTAWRIFEDANGRDIIHWEQLDEFIPVIALLTGTSSRESKRSFQKWLDSRSTKVGEDP
ncbi:DUF2442 domain-containing protein [Chloroflexi bacterium TSY]|nr:DUF2442 domain-containing protein [Chloroflexi bacterium TSY]